MGNRPSISLSNSRNKTLKLIPKKHEDFAQVEDAGAGTGRFMMDDIFRFSNKPDIQYMISINFQFQSIESIKLMKAIQILTICLLLVLLQGQTQTLSRQSIIKINPPTLPTIPRLPRLPILSSAECYQGSVVVSIEKGAQSKLSYFACFDEVTNDCSHQKCFNGWIANYTSDDSGIVQGYPNNPNVSPVFRFDINSAADFTITKSPKLSEEFDRLIDIACNEFDPTVASPRVSSAPRSSSSASFKSANIFQDVNLLIGEQIPLASKIQATYIPQFSFISSSDNLFIATAATQRISLSELQTEEASISRTLNFDSASKLVVNRNDVVNVQLSNSDLSSSREDASSPFVGKISLGLSKKGKTFYNANNLEAELRKSGRSFNVADLEAKRANINIIDLGGFEAQDIQDESKPIEEQSKVFDLNRQLRMDSVSSLSSNLGNTRLLQQTIIFSQQKVLYEKTVLGKTIKVSILVVAKLTSNNQVLVITGTLKFNFFGKTKDIVVFSRSQNVNFNWSYSTTISGTWSFNIYIPLPPPVSFMGINFGFSASYSIPILLGANGVSSASAYTCTFLADVSAALNVDASAALRVVAIEGGVFIGGTLVSVRTDPKVILKYIYAKKILELTVDWKFYLKAFSFRWGFFWRYWRLFKGWSDRKIIKDYLITNGIQQTYPILSLFKTYKL